MGGDAFARAHARVLADPSIQFALPTVPRPHPPAWVEALIRLIREAWPVLRVLVWVGLGVIALAILLQISRRLLGIRLPWRKGAADDASDAEPEWRPDGAPTRALLAEADRLAAQGRYAEAARLILHRSVEDIAARRPGLVRPATTSRDLAATPGLPAAARPAFAAISGVVETSLFADRGATGEAWAKARAAYTDFALPGHWR